MHTTYNLLVTLMIDNIHTTYNLLVTLMIDNIHTKQIYCTEKLSRRHFNEIDDEVSNMTSMRPIKNAFSIHVKKQVETQREN